MEKLVGLFMLLFVFTFLSCKDDEINYETGDDFLIKNNITDVVKIFERNTIDDNTLAIYFGNRKGKDWFALFDAKSGLLLEEWYGKERYYVNDGSFSIVVYPFFKKLKNGECVYKFHFEGTDQIVFLLENQKVRYGLVLTGMYIYDVLEGKGFLLKKDDLNSFIYDFDGNMCVDDVIRIKVDSDSKPWCIGFQEDKVWIGISNENSTLKEIVGNEKFQRNRKEHIGYGEYEEFRIEKITIGKSIKTDWGYAFLPWYYTDDKLSKRGTMDVFLINKGQLIFIPLTRSWSDSGLSNWYSGSILVENKYVFSPEGKLIIELSHSVYDDDEPVSYTEVIRFNKSLKGICRNTCTNDQNVWFTKLYKLENVQSNARITMTILEKQEQVWLYRCNIVNMDGSKGEFKFNLLVETGEVTYL